MACVGVLVGQVVLSAFLSAGASCVDENMPPGVVSLGGIFVGGGAVPAAPVLWCVYKFSAPASWLWRPFGRFLGGRRSGSGSVGWLLLSDGRPP